MNGIIINNAYSKEKASLNQSIRLKEEFEKLNVSIDIIANNKLSTYTSSDGTLISDFSKYDFCIYLDKDKYILKALELLGIPLFNNYNAIEICDDKMMTHLALASKNITMPITIPGLLCYRKESDIEVSTIERVEKILSYPIVVKESFGSLGAGVFLANNRAELTSIMEKVKLRPHLFQQFIKSSFGTDIRVIIIGGKIISAMKRQSTSDFRSNIELGGVGEPFELPNNFANIAIATANTLNIDYCGIDILFGEDNQPIVCEVNSNAFFGGFEKVTGINVAKAYALHILENLN